MHPWTHHPRFPHPHALLVSLVFSVIRLAPAGRSAPQFRFGFDGLGWAWLGLKRFKFEFDALASALRLTPSRARHTRRILSASSVQIQLLRPHSIVWCNSHRRRDICWNKPAFRKKYPEYDTTHDSGSRAWVRHMGTLIQVNSFAQFSRKPVVWPFMWGGDPCIKPAGEV